jgi:CRP-like cAMP-binding protein
VIAVGRRPPVERVAMLISMLEHSAAPRGHDTVGLALSQQDMADYLRLSVSTMRNAFATLKRRAIVIAEGARRIRIVDRRAFNALLPDAPPPSWQ